MNLNLDAANPLNSSIINDPLANKVLNTIHDINGKVGKIKEELSLYDPQTRRVLDDNGAPVYFTNAVIVLTANCGSPHPISQEASEAAIQKLLSIQSSILAIVMNLDTVVKGFEEQFKLEIDSARSSLLIVYKQAESFTMGHQEILLHLKISPLAMQKLGDK